MAREILKAVELFRGLKTMALVDPYSPCPCGSDKKFKWCCQKAERVRRDEPEPAGGEWTARRGARGLRRRTAKVPDNPWLLLRKALLLIVRQQPWQPPPRVADGPPAPARSSRSGRSADEVRPGATRGQSRRRRHSSERFCSTRPESHAPSCQDRGDRGRGAGQASTSIPAALKHFELLAQAGQLGELSGTIGAVLR